MIIKRTVAGLGEIQIELTDEELYAAFLDQQHRFDIEDIEDRLESEFPEDVLGSYGLTREDLAKNDWGQKLISKMATEKRRLISDFAMSWYQAADQAIQFYLNLYKEGKVHGM